MAKPEARARVQEKLNLAADAKEAQIETSIYNVRKVDGKITADFEVNGLPAKDKKNPSYEDRHKTIKKIFDDFPKFSAYAEEFLSKTDDEIVELFKESK